MGARPTGRLKDRYENFKVDGEGIFRHTGPKNYPHVNSQVDPDPYLKYLRVGPGLGLGSVQR